MPGSSGSYGKALAVLVLGACAIAFAPIFVRLAGAGPAAAGFWRLALALPALLAMTLWSARGRPGPALRPSLLGLLAGVFFALDLGFWHYGIKLTTVANATILANLSPLVVTGAAWVMFKERPAGGFLLGLLLALGGVRAIAAAHGAGVGIDPALGDALSVATSGWYAAYMLTVRQARAGRTAAEVMFWSSLVGAPLLLAASLVLHERIDPGPPGAWAACVGLAVVHVAGQGSIAWALGRVPAAVASMAVLVQPVLAAVLGWLIFAEPMTGLQMAGGAAALSGVALAQLAAARQRQRSADAGLPGRPPSG